MGNDAARDPKYKATTESTSSAVTRTAGAAIWEESTPLPGAFRGAVHCPQNLNPGGFSKRHLGQISTSGLVHCPQNFIPAGLSNPHLPQRIGGSPYCRRPMREYRQYKAQ
jgi:hypothetical protein